MRFIHVLQQLDSRWGSVYPDLLPWVEEVQNWAYHKNRWRREQECRTFATTSNISINGNADLEETDENVLKFWGNLRSEIRGFIRVMFRAVDIMCQAISEMDINAISENRHAAYNSGWGEPKFTAEDISELKSRRHIKNQEEYIYCRKTMEGEDTADHQARANQQLYKGFKEIWESGVPMSAEIHAAIKFGMNHHKPQDV